LYIWQKLLITQCWQYDTSDLVNTKCLSSSLVPSICLLDITLDRLYHTTAFMQTQPALRCVTLGLVKMECAAQWFFSQNTCRSGS
jgi:hypothetical protein